MQPCPVERGLAIQQRCFVCPATRPWSWPAPLILPKLSLLLVVVTLPSLVVLPYLTLPQCMGVWPCCALIGACACVSQVKQSAVDRGLPTRGSEGTLVQVSSWAARRGGVHTAFEPQGQSVRMARQIRSVNSFSLLALWHPLLLQARSWRSSCSCPGLRRGRRTRVLPPLGLPAAWLV